MNVYEKIIELGVKLPNPPEPAGVYTAVKIFSGNLAYTSGMGPNIQGGKEYRGKVGRELTVGQAQDAAKAAMLNVLSVLEAEIGDLNRVKSVIKILGFVASSEDFFEQPAVMNAATQLLMDIFGEKSGRPARSAIGTNVLPGNIPVEIEAIFELEE